MNKIFNYLVGLYLGISTIYWIPGISVNAFKYFKYLLFLSIIILPIFSLKRLKKTCFPNGIYGFLGLCLIILSFLPGILRANKNVLFDVTFGYFSSFIFLWIIYIYTRNKKLNFEKIINTTLVIVVLFSFVHVLESLFPFINLQPPGLEGSFDTFKDTGFNLSRTGWSNGLVLFIPLLFMYEKKALYKYLALLIIITSQFLSGGRAGLLTSLIIIVLILSFQNKLSYVYFISFVVFILITYNLELIIESLRLNRFVNNNINFNTLNDFSANRLAINIYGIEEWKMNPFFGNGIGNVKKEVLGNSTDIHNFWIKTLAESGVLPFLILIYFTLSPIILGLKVYMKKKINYALIFSMVIFSGFIISLFEPNTIYGSFQNSAIWWFCLPVLLALINRKYILVKIFKYE